VTAKRKRLFWIAGVVAVYLVFGNKGFRDLASRSMEKRRLEKSLVRLRKDHDRLTRELAWIKQDPTYTEYLIRKNLGYVKKGEVEYRFMKDGDQ
jgi:cell division protein FtsB